MVTITCLECGANVQLEQIIDLHDVVTCKQCGTDLEIVGLDPVEVEIVEEDYDDDDDD